MNAEKGEEDISFTNGEYLHIGEAIGIVNDEAIKRAQIRETIDIHLSKELKYIGKGIKVLSLIFIDKVSNYRLYETNGETKGKYAKWFEEEYSIEELVKITGVSRATLMNSLTKGEPLKGGRNAKYDPKYVGSQVVDADEWYKRQS